MTLAQVSRWFSPAEVAKVVGKDIATVRKWFVNEEGVRKYPRGDGQSPKKQRPSLSIPEAVAHKKLKSIGLSDAEIDALLIEPHDLRQQEGAVKVPRAAPSKRPKKKRLHRKADSNGRRPRG